LSGASGRASEQERSAQAASKQASMERERQGKAGPRLCSPPRASKQASTPYAAAAVGSGAVVEGPGERGKKTGRSREWVGGREERERCAHLHRSPG